MDLYNFDSLQAIKGEHVKVTDTEGNEVTLEISEVNRSPLKNADWDAFSVIYQGDESFRIPQGTYSFYHALFGTRQLFLSPKSAVEYETVITRKNSDAKTPDATPITMDD